MGVLAPGKIGPFVRFSRIFLGMHLSIKCMAKFGRSAWEGFPIFKNKLRQCYETTGDMGEQDAWKSCDSVCGRAGADV